MSDSRSETTENDHPPRSVVVPVLRLDLAVLFALPADAPVAVYSSNGSGPVDPALVDPSELTLIDQAIDSRRTAFTHGRACARCGLLQLGLDAGPIGRSTKRAPLFGADVTGSITHTTGFVAAVVAQGRHRTVGIDAERIERAGRDVSERVLTPDELARVAELDPLDRDRIVIETFSAKEALYKAQFQITGAWLGFDDVGTTPTATGYEMHPVTEVAATVGIAWPVVVGQHHEHGVVVSAAVCEPA